MAISSLTSRTKVTTLAETALNGRVVLQPNTWYTCPSGKKAIVKGKVTCTGLGAATEGRFSVAGTIMFRWEAVTGTPKDFSVPDNTSVYFGGFTLRQTPLNTFMLFEVTLEAGDTIITSQDSGTNAEFNLFASVLELPA